MIALMQQMLVGVLPCRRNYHKGRREVAVELEEMEHSLLSHLRMIDGLLCCCACGPKRQQLQQWERVRRRQVA